MVEFILRHFGDRLAEVTATQRR